MPSLPATISRVMPSISSSGAATIIQALENAVWPVRPVIQVSAIATLVPCAPWRVALKAAIMPPAPPPTTRMSVSIKVPCKCGIFLLTCAHSPRSRAVLHRRMDVDDLLRTKNFAAETGDAMLAKFYHRQELRLNQAVEPGLARRRLHVDHVGRAHVVANSAARALFNLDIFDHPAPASTRRIAGHYGPSRRAAVVLG